MSYDNRSVGPLKITEKSYNKKNAKMRSDYKAETGKTLGQQLTTGKNKRRISFACRFCGMNKPMKDNKGEPSGYARALKKWGFASREAACSFCKNNKAKK
tara:strand:+ start:221 stop:520 length:300 start_codon:yes stop_codon:yes gene_type:complete